MRPRPFTPSPVIMAKIVAFLVRAEVPKTKGQVCVHALQWPAVRQAKLEKHLSALHEQRLIFVDGWVSEGGSACPRWRWRTDEAQVDVPMPETLR